MDHNASNGNISFLISIFLGVMSFLIGNIDIIMKLSVALASVIAAIMAIRYHYYATRERKQQIEFNIQQEKRNIEQETRNVNQKKEI